MSSEFFPTLLRRSAPLNGGPRDFSILPITLPKTEPMPSPSPEKEHFIFRVTDAVLPPASSGITVKILPANKNRVGLKIHYSAPLGQPPAQISDKTPVTPQATYTLNGGETLDFVPPFGPQNAVYAKDAVDQIQMIETIRVFGDDFFRGQE